MSEKGEIPFAFIDGYSFGDRLLEGAMFKITITKDNKFKAETLPKDKDYLDGLNMKKWMKAALEYVKDNDIFFVDANCNEEAWIVDEFGKINPHISNTRQPIEIPSVKWSDIKDEIIKTR